MSNSSSARQLNYPLNKKITNRNPIFRSSSNFGQQSSVLRPFSRKPINQTDQSSLEGSKIVENDLDVSALQKSLLEVQSVVSGGKSAKQSKFVRTNRNSFLSPKSKKKDRGQSFSPDNIYGTQSMILRGGPSQSKKILKDSINEKYQVLSQQSQVQQHQIYLQKSVSSSNLYRKNNKTRNMILSKFSQMSKKSKDKPSKNKLETSLHVDCYENEKQQRKRVQKINNELKQQNEQTQKECQNLNKQNSNLLKQNIALKNDVAQLKKRVQQLQSSKSLNPVLQQKTSAQNNFQSLYQNTTQRQKPPVPPINDNKKCQKCEQKQKSNQKQVTYFQNIIKKKQTQLVALRRKQAQLSKDNNEMTVSLQQTTHKFNQLLQHERISSQNEQKLQQCVNELKQEVARLKDQLRYLKIENSVLLKIKNENLKLKIDITKIEDERDYFKMKVIQIHKKHGTSQISSSKSIQQKFVRDKSESNKKTIASQKSKKFYLDSTDIEQMDSFNIGSQRKSSRTKTVPSGSDTSRHMINKTSKHKSQQNETTLHSPYSDTLFDLTSEESQNSY